MTRDKLRVDYKDEDGNILLDSDGSTPCGPYIAHGLSRSRDRYGASGASAVSFTHEAIEGTPWLRTKSM